MGFYGCNNVAGMDTRTFYGKRYERLQDAVESVASPSTSRGTVDFVILPPDQVDEQTDEEECDDDGEVQKNCAVSCMDVPGILIYLLRMYNSVQSINPG